MTGVASYYADAFHGRRTASGERYDRNAHTAASNRFGMGSWLRITNLRTGLQSLVRVNDRMGHRTGRARVVDVSRRVAELLGMIGDGLAPVAVQMVPPPESAPAVPASPEAGPVEAVGQSDGDGPSPEAADSRGERP